MAWANPKPKAFALPSPTTLKPFQGNLHLFKVVNEHPLETQEHSPRFRAAWIHPDNSPVNTFNDLFDPINTTN